MNCRVFEERLCSWLDGETPHAAAAEIEAHAAGCPACRGFAALVAGAPEAPPVVAPADLLESVLARTSGQARREARALSGLDVDLPELAWIRPDARFVDDVLRRTSRTPARRAARAWRDLVLRPRLALEGAYAGALLVVALAGLGVPVGRASRETLSVVSSNPVHAALRPARGLTSDLEAALTRARTTVDGVARSLDERLEPLRQAAERAYSKIQRTSQEDQTP